jgi:hypothetical protein
MASLLRATSRHLLTAAVVLAAGCGGTQPSSVSSTDASVSMLPATHIGATNFATRNGRLVYASEYNAGDVAVYPFKGEDRLQSLPGFQSPGDLCADSAQNVYVPGGYSFFIAEYRHGVSKPIKLLADPNGIPSSCSVDPTTGNLAVVNGVGSAQYGVLLYRRARGIPKLIVDPSISYYYFCGFDNAGNLYIDGQNSNLSQVEIAVLPHGKTAFVNLTANKSIGFPGDVRWDGRFIAIGNQSKNEIYRFSVTGAHAKLQGVTLLGGAADVIGFWIDGDIVVGADYRGNQIGYWKYPGGGAALQFVNGIQSPLGVTVSKR